MLVEGLLPARPWEVGGGQVETLALALGASLVGGRGTGSPMVGMRTMASSSPGLCVQQHRESILDMA